jgi:hypothetical protein
MFYGKKVLESGYLDHYSVIHDCANPDADERTRLLNSDNTGFN